MDRLAAWIVATLSASSVPVLADLGGWLGWHTGIFLFALAILAGLAA